MANIVNITPTTSSPRGIVTGSPIPSKFTEKAHLHFRLLTIPGWSEGLFSNKTRKVEKQVEN